MIQAKLSLVLPAHNEVENIGPVVERAVSVLPSYFTTYEILIVNDGSTDGTREVADGLVASCEHVRVIHHPQNRGYGGALRSGFSASTGDWVMVMDSDRQFDPDDLIYLVPYVGEYDLVAGYRLQRNDPAHRILFGQTFKIAMSILFGVRLRDIDCAFKVMRGDLLRSLDLRSPGALISTELIARWIRAGGTWVEVGVHHYPRPAGEQSGGSFKVILRAMWETLVLWYRLDQEQRHRGEEHTLPRTPGLSPRAAAAGVLVLAALTAVLIRVFRRCQRSS
jgi:glycosyltransferase involved in cell wall biosynthesis